MVAPSSCWSVREGVCTLVFLCRCILTGAQCVCMYRWRQEVILGVIPRCYLFCFLRQDISLGPGPCQLGWPSSPYAPQVVPSALGPAFLWLVRFLHGCWGLNSGSHALLTSTLMTKPTLHYFIRFHSISRLASSSRSSHLHRLGTGIMEHHGAKFCASLSLQSLCT